MPDFLDDLCSDIKEDEGWRATVYKDSEGYWTIGYGFLVDPIRGGGLPKNIGELWLRQAAESRWKVLITRVPWITDQPLGVQRALGSMAFQLGVRGVMRFKKMLEALEAHDRSGAADEALDSKWAIQTPERAKRISNLIRGH